MNVKESVSRGAGASFLILCALLATGCEKEPVRGFNHGEFDVIPFATELSDLETDIGRNVVYVADQQHNQIHVLDADMNEILRSIPVGSKPVRMQMDPDETVLMVALQGEQAVAVIDPDLGIVTRKLSVPFEVVWLDVTGDGRVFVGPDDPVDGETLALDSDTGEILHDIAVASGWNPVGEFISIQDSVLILVRSDDIYKWDISDRNAAVYSQTADVELIRAKHELASSNDGSLVYVSGVLGRQSQVEVFRTSNLSKAGVFEAQQGVTFLCLSPDGTRAFIATATDMMAQPISPATYILEYDAATYAPVNQHLALGNMNVTSLEVSPDGQRLYVVVENPYRITDNPTQERRQDLQVIGLR